MTVDEMLVCLQAASEMGIGDADLLNSVNGLSPVAIAHINDRRGEDKVYFVLTSLHEFTNPGWTIIKPSDFKE